MQKEVFFAIFFGFIIGILVTFGAWQANKAIKTNSTPTPTPTISEITQPVKPSLNILSPANEFLSKDSKVVVRGTYIPDSQIAVIYEGGEKIIKTDSDGSFETEISLILGENQIEFYGFTKEGEEAKQILTIVHSTAEI